MPPSHRGRERPSVRLLFDELLPYRVALALNVLGFHTSHVGHEGHDQPRRGATDEVVLAHAVKTKQIVVTSNHDMIMLCAEQRQPVVWIDPYGRQVRHDELVVIAFGGIARWQALLDEAAEPVCVRVLRSKVEVLSLERAAALVEKRMRAPRTRRKRPRKPAPQAGGQLSAGE